MIKNALIALLIAFLFVLPTTTAIRSQPNFKQDRYLTFETMLELTYDPDSLLNVTFAPDGPPVQIPLTISSRTNLPPFLLTKPFSILKNWFISGKIITPPRTVRLSVINQPDWAAIAIKPTTPTIPLTTTWTEASSTITIACRDDAPAEPFTLKIKAEMDSMKHLSSASTILEITIEPEWIPLISIDTIHGIVLPNNQSSNISINITNMGNGWTLVNTDIYEIQGWSLDLNPSLIMIDARHTNMTELYVLPPIDFTGDQIINMWFTPTHNGEIGPSHLIQIQVRCY
jgi:hypothetical protein